MVGFVVEGRLIHELRPVVVFAVGVEQKGVVAQHRPCQHQRQHQRQHQQGWRLPFAVFGFSFRCVWCLAFSVWQASERPCAATRLLVPHSSVAGARLCAALQRMGVGCRM